MSQSKTELYSREAVSRSNFAYALEYGVVDGNQFSFENHNYLIDIYMDDHRYIVLEKAAQMGASVYGMLAAFRVCDKLGLNVIYFFPTDNDVMEFSKARVGPMLNDSPHFKEISLKQDSLGLRQVGRGWLYFRGLKSNIAMKSVPADFLVFDELDEVTNASEALADQRLNHSSYKRRLKLSTPTVEGAGIDRVFKESDQRYWNLVCKGCGAYNILEEAFPDCVMKKDNGELYLGCFKCRAELDTQYGLWIPKKPEVTYIRGYHISGLYSYFLSLEDLMREYESGYRREEFFRSKLGIPYTSSNQRVTLDMVYACRGEYDNYNIKPHAYMGVDQKGDEIHIVVRKFDRIKGKDEILFIGKVPRWDMLDNYIRRFDIDECLAGDTRVVTSQGVRPIKELSGSEHWLMTRNGAWTKAPVKSFGFRETMKVTLYRHSAEKVVYATPNHSWRLWDKRTGCIKSVLTTELKPGQKLAYSLHSYLNKLVPSVVGIQHGITFGDGTRDATDEMGVQQAKIYLYGDKNAQLVKYFEHCNYSVSHHEPYGDCKVSSIYVSGLPRLWKELPALNAGRSYLYGWLAGYFAADGCISDNGSSCFIQSHRRSDLEFVKEVCYILGIGAYSIIETERGEQTKKPGVDYRLQFMRDTLTEDFFLMEHHRGYWTENPTSRRQRWLVKSVESTDFEQEVFCATVPETSEFVLEDNILIGNCVVDGLPNQHSARDFAARFPGRVHLCYYNENQKGDYSFTERQDGEKQEWAVSVNRTEALDAMYEQIFRREMTYPRDAPEEFAKQLTMLVRVNEEDDDGTILRAVWQRYGEDHYAHAMSYSLIAASRFGGSQPSAILVRSKAAMARIAFAGRY